MKKYIIIFFLTALVASIILHLKSDRYNFRGVSGVDSVDLHSFDGEYKVLLFGFTMCPDVCPTTLNLISTILNDIEAKNVKIVFISLDPKRDNPKETQEFVKYFYPNSASVILKDDELMRVAKNYGAKFQKIELKDSVMDYSIAHSSSLYLFDKSGNFVEEISNLTYDNVKNALINLTKI